MTAFSIRRTYTSQWTLIAAAGICIGAVTACGSGPDVVAEEDIAQISESLTNGAAYNIKIPNIGTNKCVDVNQNSAADGANVQLWTCNTSSAQRFVAKDMGSGWWAFRHDGTDKWLNRNTSANNSSGGGNVHQWYGGANDSWLGSPEFQWKPVASGSYWKLQNRYDSNYLDVNGSSSTDGANIQTWTSNTSNAQIFNPVTAGSSCTPNCSGKQCGSDGCGGSCGNCQSGYTCSSNQCVAASGSGKIVVGYIQVPYASSTSIQYSKLTHINAAFWVPNSNGTLAPPWTGVDYFTNTVVPTAHNNGVKVCISIGGWMTDSPGAGIFDSAVSSAYRTTLVNNIVSVVNNTGADCADIDFEYVGSDAASNYNAFIDQLDGALGSGKLLTAAVAAFGSNADTFPSGTFDNFNFINVMAYDIQNCQHASYQHAVDSLNYWKNRGMPASKLTLGLPMYSHTCSGFGPVYKELYNANSANACRDSDGTNYWNGIPLIRQKGELARGYGGIMYWELAQDHSSASLLTAGYEAVNSTAYSYSCSGGGGGGGNCTPYAHGSAGPCGWWTYSDCCTADQVCASTPGCVP